MDLTQYGFLQGYRNKKRLFLDILTIVLSGVFLLYIGDLIKNYPQTPEVIKNAQAPIIIATFFLFLASIFVLVKDFLRRALVAYDCVYKFKNQDWPKEWIFNGKPEPFVKNGELFIKSSRAGSLVKNYQWKNLKITFDMKFNPSRTRPLKNLGLIFRAEDLDNYFMLEILQDNPFDGKPITGLKPHVRFNSGWEMMDIEEIDLNFSSFKKVCLEVQNDIITLFYEDNSIFKWVLPTHVDVNHVEAGFKPDDSGQKNILGKDVAKGVQEIPFRIAYGRVGFRAHPGQGAIVKNLKIEPL